MNRKSYPFSEYLEAALITAGVTAFHLTEHKAGGHYAEHQDSMFGIFLLCLYLACDSFTSQVQLYLPLISFFEILRLPST